MPSAKKKRKSKKGFLSLAKLILFVLFPFCFVCYFWPSKYYKKEKKLLLVNPQKEAIYIDVFDLPLNKIVSVMIPNNCEVDVARNLGKWRIGSVWELGENEDLRGKLLAETVMINFKAPTFLWAGSVSHGLIDRDLKLLGSFLFFPNTSNLPFIDRLRLTAFALKVKDFKKEVFNLEESSFLKNVKLKDGKEGYILSERMPQPLLLIFSDSKFAEEKVNVTIVNASGEWQLSKQVGEVIETMGAKVVLVKTIEEKEIDCVVYGRDKSLASSLAMPFNCQIKVNREEGESDLEIEIGSEFTKRF